MDISYKSGVLSEGTNIGQIYFGRIPVPCGLCRPLFDI